jgi:subfamily B ATP-binding cassette protein MsbA
MLSMILFALLSGALVWLIGPLMATLFEYDSMHMGVEQVKADDSADSGKKSGDGQIIIGGVERLREKIKVNINALIVSDTKTKTLRNLCLVLLLIALAKSVFFYLRGYIMAFVEQKFIRNLRVDLFIHYQKLSLAYFHGTRTGKLISHVTNDVTVLRESINQTFNRIITDPLLILIYITFMFLISWKLLLISAVVLPLAFGMMYLIGKKLRKYSRRAQEQMANVNTVLEENVSNIRIVKGFNTNDYEIGKFTKQADNYFKTLLKIFRVRHLSSPINELLGTAAVVLILGYGGQNVLAGGGISASDFVLFTFAMFSLIAPAKSISNMHILIQEGMAAAERIFFVLDSPVEVKDASNATEIGKFSNEIRFENVGFSYRTTPNVLKNINFEARKGQLIAIVGPSGAGKSTLCDLIPRFYDPTEGRITLDGIDLRQITLSSLRSQLGIVTQETMLFNDTIYNNITYGLDGVTMEQVIEATKIANAYGFIMDFENGFETPIGNRGVMLSGGQRQRIAIARAVLRNPEILIFDEATSALDTESEQLVQEAIDRLLKGRTTIVIAHRLSTILNADKILVIKDGCLVDSGTHPELISRKGLYQRLYNLQFKEQNGNGS